MNILIDARESGTSTGRYIDKLIEHLHALKPEHQITVMTKPHRLAFFETIAPGFQRAETQVKEFTLAEQTTLLAELNSYKPDLVHFGMVQQPVRYKGKSVTTMHDLTTVRFKNPAKNPIIFTLKQHVYAWVNKQVAKKTNQILVPTAFVKQDIANFTSVNPEKINITYEAADPISEPAAEITELVGKKFIFFVGRALPHKNLEKLLQAFEILNTSQPELYLVFAGKKSNNYEVLAAQAAESPAAPSIIFTDFITDGQLRWMYENAEAYVFPSLSEGFGLPGLEAMVHGCPVVSSDATCLPEVYEDAAVYFDPNNPEDMASKIKEVISDDALRSQLIARGLAQSKKYSWRRMAEQTAEVYHSVLKG